MERQSQARFQSGAFVAIVAAALVFANLLAVKVVTRLRFDLTKRELYTLSQGTRRTLQRLADTVTITVYWSPDQPAPANDDERLLREQLQEYVAAGNDRVVVRWVRTDNDERRRQADSASCPKRPLQAVNMRERQATFQEVYRCMTFQYLRNSERIEFVPPSVEGLEYQVTSIIKKMIDPERRIGFLTGHDESSVDQALPYLSRILQEAHLGYTTTTVNLNGGNDDIPADIKGLVILNPSRRMEERELRRINGYLMRGGSVAVFASGVNTTGSDTRPSATRNEHNLNALLEGYGITLNSDVVLDYQGMDSIQEIEMGRVRIPMFAYPALLAQREDGGPGINVAHPSVFRLPLVVAPFVSSLTLNESRARENGTQLTVVGRTTVRSVAQRDNFELNAVELIERRNSVFARANGPHTVAVALEGQLRSAFAAETPETNNAAGDAGVSAAPVQTPAHASQSNPARLLVVGSGKMFGIDQLRSIAPIQGGIPTNVQMLLNVFDWLSQDPDLLAVRAKDVSEPTLGEVSETKKNLFQWGSIFGLPLLVGLLGVFMARMRAQRRAELAASMGGK